LLASAGYRVIVPYLRGYGSTHFLSSDTVRNGQQSVVALDAIALMDALKIERRPSPVLTGARGPPASSRRSGRNAAKRWSPSADT
jgi:pimeloyl-ACP methyl ester carboxylesterase